MARPTAKQNARRAEPDQDAINVRAPVPTDGPQIGRVHVRAWKLAYDGLMSEEFLAGLDEVERGEAWHQRLVARSRGHIEAGTELLVAERGDPHREIVGIATIGADRDDPTRSRGELWMINVLPEAWGSGAGPALLRAAEDRLRQRGFDQAVLWVVTGNRRARRFYEREGWEPDGANKQQEIGGHPVAECRYRRRLSSKNR